MQVPAGAPQKQETLFPFDPDLASPIALKQTGTLVPPPVAVVAFQLSDLPLRVGCKWSRVDREVLSFENPSRSIPRLGCWWCKPVKADFVNSLIPSLIAAITVIELAFAFLEPDTKRFRNNSTQAVAVSLLAVAFMHFGCAHLFNVQN